VTASFFQDGPNRIGDYEILERIGGGGMAEVFLGRKTGTSGFEKRVAIKRILPHLAGEQAFVRMLIDEARIAAGFNHSNIIQIYELGEMDGSPFIVMEWIRGVSLLQIHRQLRQLERRIPPPSAAALLVSAVCAALDYAHSRRDNDGRPLQIIHRDVSPSNVLVSHEGDVKLIDFGIAKAAQRLYMTKTGTVKGKQGYIAPEQLMGRPVDHRADLFAAGVVLYELLTGTNPFHAANELEALERARIGKVAPPSSVASGVPPALEQICLKALSVNPDRRYQRASEMEQALDQYLQDDPFGRLDLAAWIQTLFHVAPVPGPNQPTHLVPPDSRRSPARRETIVQLFEEVRASLFATLNIRADHPGARVLLDGTQVGHTPLELAVPAGRHEVELRSVDWTRGATIRVELKPGERRSLNAALQLIRQYRPASPSPAPPTAHGRRLWTWVAAGSALATLVVGIAVYASAQRTYGNLEDSYDQLYRDGDAAAIEDLKQDVRRKDAASVVMFSLCGALTATAVTLYFLEPRLRHESPHGSARLLPIIGPAPGLALDLRF